MCGRTDVALGEYPGDDEIGRLAGYRDSSKPLRGRESDTPTGKLLDRCSDREGFSYDGAISFGEAEGVEREVTDPDAAKLGS